MNVITSDSYVSKLLTEPQIVSDTGQRHTISRKPSLQIFAACEFAIDFLTCAAAMLAACWLQFHFGGSVVYPLHRALGIRRLHRIARRYFVAAKSDLQQLDQHPPGRGDPRRSTYVASGFGHCPAGDLTPAVPTCHEVQLFLRLPHATIAGAPETDPRLCSQEIAQQESCH